MSASAVVFDLDGTLVDSIPTVAAILNQMRREAGQAALPLGSFHPWISKGGVELMENSLQLSGANAAAALVDFRSRYLADESSASLVYPMVLALLQQLQMQGIALAICTNKPRALVDKLLAQFDLARHFQFVLAGDDGPTLKPDPKNLELCLERLGVDKAHAVLVGDSLVDQRCADNAGVRYAFFAGGYDDGVDYDAAWLVFHHHQELSQALLSWQTKTSSTAEP